MKVSSLLQVMRANGLHVDQQLRAKLLNVVQLAQQPYDFRQLARALDEFVNILSRETIVLTDFLCEHRPPISLANVELFLSNAEAVELGPIPRQIAEIAKQHDLDSKSSPVRGMSLENKAILIRDLQDSGLDNWQIRQSLGISCETYEKLKSIRWRERPQTGLESTFRPWSKVKELFNSNSVDLFVESPFCSSHPPLILETCQGLGDATMIYRKIGTVVSYERDDSDENGNPYSFSRMRFLENRCLREFEPHSPGFMEDLKSEIAAPCPDGNFQVWLPTQPTDALDGIDRLHRYGWRFDIIDIDPFGSSFPLFEKVLGVVEDKALILFTVGDMYQGGKPTGYKQAFGQLGCDFAIANTVAQRELWKANLWRAVGARAVVTAWEKGFCLVPFGAYVAAQPTKYIEFGGEKIGVCGIDRLLFLTRKLNPTVDVLFTPDQVVLRDSILKCDVLRHQLENGKGRMRPLPFFEFIEIWNTLNYQVMMETSLPENIAVKLDEAFKWSASILAV